MNIIYTLLFFIVCNNLIAQVTYLDFTGLTNANALSSVAIGATGFTFDANITRVGTPGNPTVTSNGNIDFKMNSSTSKQCLNLTFSGKAQFVIEHNTSHSSFLNEVDSVTISELDYVLVDPSNNITLNNVGGNAKFIPKVDISNYSTWSITYNSLTSVQVCTQRSAAAAATNKKMPLRFGVVTATLPIELLSFHAKLVDEVVQLNWETSSELDNEYFTLEKSIDNENWIEVGRVEGAGNSNQSLKYSFTDNSPYKNSETYYRLKQTDFNGQVTYSKIDVINFITNELNVFPNPAKDVISISNEAGLLNSDIKIYDISGKLINDQISFIGKEKNNSLSFNISNLPFGAYFIKAKGISHTFIKE